ncbi:MAG: S8 family serine peptidase [Bacteroidia bacterium]|nr:S8 family serine peptidase [Bacteroidia bacterium]
MEIKTSYMTLIAWTVAVLSQAITANVLKAQTAPHEPNTVVLKIHESYGPQCHNASIDLPEIQTLLSQIGAVSVAKRFPNAKKPDRPFNAYGKPLIDLTTVYWVKLDGTTSVPEACQILSKSPLVKYAEPNYEHKPFYTPNDPELGSQWWVQVMQAEAAWDITRGDTNVVIGVADTGFQYDHPDLVGNLKYNYNDPINGVDDDGDGWTDNFRGWDLCGADVENFVPDNDPYRSGTPHGAMVSGCAGAHTDNDVGVASPGFRCKWVPIKCSPDNHGSIWRGYDGIYYAATMGYDVVNCSWGGSSYSFINQEIVLYAANNRNCLVVAAIGNSGGQHLEQYLYPACYEGVLGVGGSNSSDNLSHESSVSHLMDVLAPAGGVRCPSHSNGYESFGVGYTSHASPIAASVAALVKARYPDYNPYQLIARLRATADDVSAQIDPVHWDKIGSGRLNMHRAVTLATPGIEMTDFTTDDGGDQILTGGETFNLVGNFTNWLDPSSPQLNVTLVSLSSYVTVNQGFAVLGALNGLQQTQNSSAPFNLTVSADAPDDASFWLKLVFSDPENGYSDHQCFRLYLNPTFRNMTRSRLHTSFNARGSIGYNDYPANQQGLGVVYNGGANMLYEGGMLVGNAPDRLADRLRSNAQPNPNNDFVVDVFPAVSMPGALAEEQGYAAFHEDLNGLTIEKNLFAWQGDDFVVVQYVVGNSGDTTVPNIHLGLMMDWDIANYATNHAGYDAQGRFTFARTADGSQWAGVAVLTDETVHARTVVPGQFTFNDANKFAAISGGTAAAAVENADVITFTAVGPFDLAPGQSRAVAFAILGGTSQSALVSAAEQARNRYQCHILNQSTLRFVAANKSAFVPPGGSGTLRVRAVGGSAPYTYSLDGGPEQTSGTFSGVAAGPHVVRVTDSAGCRAYLNIDM